MVSADIETACESTPVALARLDERIKGISTLLDRSERDRDRAIKLASDELARRLDVLNHAHQNAVEAQSKTVSRELFDTTLKDINARIATLEMEAREWRGKLWLPMLVVAAVAATMAATAVRMFLK